MLGLMRAIYRSGARKGSSYEGGFRVPAIAWWPGKVKPGTVNMDMWSHMDWWPTVAKLAGLEPPPHDWKDNKGDPIIFDGIDLSDSLLGTGPGKRETFVYFNDQSFGGIRVKNYKTCTTPKTPGLGLSSRSRFPRSTICGGIRARCTTSSSTARRQRQAS